jgi:hypothetical protein
MRSRYRPAFLMALGAGVAIAIGVPLVVWAGGSTQSGGGRSGVDTQSFKWTSQEQATSSSDWTSIDALSGAQAGCARGGATATVSLHLAPGSQAEVRVVMRDLSLAGSPVRAMRPRAVAFSVGTSSFTFVTGRVPGIHGSSFRLQWRSAIGGQPATLQDGSINVLWDAPRRCA